MKQKRKIVYGLIGFGAGILNGLFGAGGGVVVVPALERTGIPAKKAHATSLAVILPASLLSTVLYSFSGNLELMQTLYYLPGGLIGAGIGAVLLRKIKVKLLKLFFALLIIIGAGRILLQ